MMEVDMNGRVVVWCRRNCEGSLERMKDGIRGDGK